MDCCLATASLNFLIFRKMSSTTRYSFLLGIQVTLIFLDILFNACSEFSKFSPELQLVVFVFQNVLIILSVTVMCISFFATDMFQAGLVGAVLGQFKLPLFTSALYFTLTIALHAWLLTERWSDPNKFVWSPELTSFFSVQRFFSPFYYYTTKRAILLISDPRFYKIPIK